LSRQKKVTQEKATPLIPETPEIEPAERAAKNSPRLTLLILFLVGGAQTPSPLIRPAGSISGGTERGRNQNQFANVQLSPT